jgi:hypothetical protein
MIFGLFMKFKEMFYIKKTMSYSSGNKGTSFHTTYRETYRVTMHWVMLQGNSSV